MAQRIKTTSRPADIAVPRQTSFPVREWLWGLLLVLAVFVVYQPVWYAGYVWDDDSVLTANPVVVGPLGLKEIWTTSAADICPLTLSTFWLENQIWGAVPLPYHLVNVLLQAICAVLLWRVLLALRIPGAWLGAALWALHPVQVESVAWVSEMKNTESGMFYLLAILYFVRFLKPGNNSNSRWSYALAILFAVLAMACKSSTVILPVVLCLVAWWMDGKWLWRRIADTGPVFLAAIVAGAVTAYLQNPHHAVTANLQWSRTWRERFASAGDAVWFYLGKLVWPHPLLAVYPRWTIDSATGLSYLPLALVVILFAVLWIWRDAWARPWFFAFAYFLVALAPVVGFIDNSIFRFSFVFDHFQYLAAMGPLALAGAGFARLAALIVPHDIRPRSLAGASLLVVLGTLSWSRAWTFQNAKAIWTDVLSKDPNSAVAYASLCLISWGKGDVQEALDDGQKAVALSPSVENCYDYALALEEAGKLPDAIAEYERALAIDPDLAKAHYNLGVLFVRTGKLDEGEAEYRRAIQVMPGFGSPHNNLSGLLLQQGQINEAVEEGRAAVNCDSRNATAHNTFGFALAKAGNSNEAVAEYEKAIALNPGLAEAHNNLGIEFAKNGQLNEAVAQFQEALRLKPDYLHAQNNLDNAEAQLRSMESPR
jgi:tetratricopeptide (TPR) repeat protein